MAQFTIPPRGETKEMRFQMGYALSDLAQTRPERARPLEPDMGDIPAISPTGLRIETDDLKLKGLILTIR